MGGIIEDNLSPAMKQYARLKVKYPDCILLFRMGDFYEMFYDDAELASKILNITLTSRGKNEKKAPLAGIPLRAANTYIQRLIKSGHKLVIADQIEDPKTVKGRIVMRDVTRIITPGTILEDDLLDSRQNNYICSIYQRKDSYGIAFADITTGEFACCHTSSLQSLKNELARINPAECILPISLKVSVDLLHLLKELNIFTSDFDDINFDAERCKQTLLEHFNVQSLRGFGIENNNEIISSAGALILYLKETQRQKLTNIKKIRFININDYMMLDAVTIRNLELFENIVERSQKNTLISVLDNCATPMGSRLLRKWIERPLLNREKINSRLDAIQELTEKRILAEKIRDALKGAFDIERITSKLSFNNILPRDLIAIKDTLGRLPEIKQIGASFSSRLLHELDAMPLLAEVAKAIENSIKDEPSNKVTEGNIIKEGFNKELDELRVLKDSSREILRKIEENEIEKTGIKTLKVGYNNVIGYFIQVSKSYIPNVPQNYIKKQTLTGGERYITEELKELEAKILGAEEKIKILEYELFKQIVGEVEKHIAELQDIANKISLADALANLALCALKYNYCRPIIQSEDSIIISNGRHPVIEMTEAGFIPNDILLNSKELIILTGPNMAGKSTYMRQVCLIALMAQMGSFIPADSAKICITDRIFTRVGAYDDLAHGQSTFMLEMDETANILNNATEKSLIILDEIGRGTSTFDGVSIAWSVAEYIFKRLKSKTLFATHYHVLNKMSEEYPGIRNCSIAVKEKPEGIIFLRKIVGGGTDKSYGIHVAKLAGMPHEVIVRALEIQEELTQSDTMLETLAGKKDEKQFSLKDWEK